MPAARPTGYPTQLERELTLGDGRRVHARPVVPSDAAALVDAIAHADPETLRLRFLSPNPRFSADDIRHLVEVDYVRRLALAAFDDAGHGVAIARYEGHPDGDDAELAIVVTPGWRRVGLGTQLLDLIGAAAAANGIRWLTADYLAENEEVARLVAKSHLPHTIEVTAGVTSVRLELPPTAGTEQQQ